MATKYYDPTASGANDGSSQADAWETLQAAADGAVAGDKVLCRYTVGGEAPAAKVDFDTNDGSRTSPIEFVGVNSSWVEDGTRCAFDLTSASGLQGLSLSRSFLVFRNITVKNATRNGWYINADHLMFVNCLGESNGWSGWSGGYSSTDNHFLVDCVSKNNGDAGFGGFYGTFFLRCSATGNGGTAQYDGAGFSAGYEITLKDCISHNNGEHGIVVKDFDDAAAYLINCVIDGNTGDGVNMQGGKAVVSACRITNNTDYGIDQVKGYVHYEHNVIVDNSSGATNSSGGVLEDAGGNVTTGSAGYVDRDNDNFTTATDAQVRREAVTIG